MREMLRRTGYDRFCLLENESKETAKMIFPAECCKMNRGMLSIDIGSHSIRQRLQLMMR
jgi:hypothetical protein